MGCRGPLRHHGRGALQRRPHGGLGRRDRARLPDALVPLGTAARTPGPPARRRRRGAHRDPLPPDGAPRRAVPGPDVLRHLHGRLPGQRAEPALVDPRVDHGRGPPGAGGDHRPAHRADRLAPRLPDTARDAPHATGARAGPRVRDRPHRLAGHLDRPAPQRRDRRRQRDLAGGHARAEPAAHVARVPRRPAQLAAVRGRRAPAAGAAAARRPHHRGAPQRDRQGGHGPLARARVPPAARRGRLGHRRRVAGAPAPRTTPTARSP